MRPLLIILWLALVSSALAQPTLRIGADTRLVGSGVARITYGGGTLTNNGSLSMATGPLVLNGPTTYGGTGTATVVNLGVNGITGSNTLNSLVSVTGLIALRSNATLNTNGQLYLRTDQFPNAAMITDGILTGTVQGLVTRATVTTGAVPYTSTLSVNMSGSVMKYQWQSSANNSTWTDVPGATGATYTATVTASVYLRCRFTTTNSSYDQPSPGLLLTATSPPGQTACRNSRVVLTSPKAATRYEWYKNGQTAANKLIDVASIQVGTTTASLTLVSVQTSGTYYVKEIQANGSFTWSGPFAVTVDARCSGRIGQDEPRLALSVRATPNPVEDGQLRAEIIGAAGQKLTVQLVDNQGYIIKEQHWEQAGQTESVSWDVGHKSAGVYILQAVTNYQRQAIKVLKL
jgi:hypothetical protein